MDAVTGLQRAPMEEVISTFDMPSALNRIIFTLCTCWYYEVWEFASFTNFSLSLGLRAVFPYFLFLPMASSENLRWLLYCVVPMKSQQYTNPPPAGRHRKEYHQDAGTIPLL